MLLPNMPFPNIRGTATATTRYYKTTTATAATAKVVKAADTTTPHQPPLPVRVALVSATTALATPVFPAIGFVNLFLRVVLPEPHLRATISTSIGTVLSFATWTLVPAFYSVAPVILPCAIGNGLVAGATYAAVDVASGGPTSRVLRRNPLAAGGIGAVTGIVAPYFLYGPVCSAMYGIEGVTESTRFLLAFPFATQVTMATGFVAGLAMYPLLYFPMNGIRGLHWIYFSGTALAASALALWYVYSPYGDDERMLLPEGSFVQPAKIPLLDAIVRYNAATGEMGAYSISSGDWIGPVEMREEGHRLADILRQNKDPAFDDKVVAWLGSYTFMDVASRYPDRVVTVRNQKSIQAKEDAMLATDGVVAFMLERSKKASSNREGSLPATREKLLDVANIITQSRYYKNSRTQSMKNVALIETMSIAVELLMMLHQQTDDQNEQKQALIKEIENFVQMTKLDLVVFTGDEKVKGESIESQLQDQAWKGGDAANVAAAVVAWKRVHEDDQHRRRKDLAFQVGAVLLSIGGVVLLNQG
jgi:hypothetical protein